MESTGFWAKHKDSLLFKKDGVLCVNQSKLYALPWKEQIHLVYDSATPNSVVAALKYSQDQSVVAATFARAKVLSGEAKNPFYGEKP